MASRPGSPGVGSSRASGWAATGTWRSGPLFAGLAELPLWRGDLEQAKRLVAEAVPLVEADPRYAAPVYGLGMRIEADRTELAAWHATGLAERTRQEGPSDPAAWAVAVAAWERLSQPYRVAYACFGQAEALLAGTGDRDAAATAPAADAPTPAEQLGLTPREAEVLALVAAGRSNRQIAHALFISTKTASVHVSNILAKLGVHTRVEAAATAHRLGLD